MIDRIQALPNGGKLAGDDLVPHGGELLRGPEVGRQIPDDLRDLVDLVCKLLLRVGECLHGARDGRRVWVLGLERGSC